MPSYDVAANVVGPDVTSKIEWGTYLVLNSTQNDAVDAALKKSGSSISVEWETGPKNHIGFAESLAINN